MPATSQPLLYRARSAYQDIVLAAEPGGYISLTLDDVWQFHSRDEHIFHETLADTPMLLAEDPARVLILGGGDGLALRNVLRYPQVREVTLVELDGLVIDMARSVPALIELSERSLADARVRVVVGDALAFVAEARAASRRWDVLICDFPAATTPTLSRLFAPAFYAELAALTHEQSVVSIQVSLDASGFWAVCDAVEASFAWLHPMLANLGVDDIVDHDWADFVIAAHGPRTICREPPAALRFLTRERIFDLGIQGRGGPVLVTREYGAQDLG